MAIFLCLIFFQLFFPWFYIKKINVCICIYKQNTTDILSTTLFWTIFAVQIHHDCPILIRRFILYSIKQIIILRTYINIKNWPYDDIHGHPNINEKVQKLNLKEKKRKEIKESHYFSGCVNVFKRLISLIFKYTSLKFSEREKWNMKRQGKKNVGI